jgi:hypothetical protein
MAYSLALKVQLGLSMTGKTLRAQLKDTSGANVGGVVTTGFIELGGGEYGWLGSIPDGFRGYVVFSDNGTLAYYCSSAINPEETGTVLALATSSVTAAALKDDAVTKIAAGVASASEGTPLAADLVSVTGTVLMESISGRLAGALSHFLDVASPALTAASVNQSADVAAVKTVTDHLATTLELNAGNYRFTVAALANAPSGGGGALGTDAISAAAVSAAAGAKIADIVFRRTMAHVFASSDGDPVSKNSLYGELQKNQKSGVVGTTLTVLNPNGTTLGAFQLVVDVNGLITGIG